jgi:putative redox protein
MSDDTHRQVTVERAERGVYVARNARGGELRVSGDDGATFTPVELLLVAIGACTAVDVDTVTSRRAEPDHFVVTVDAEKIRDAGGSALQDLQVTFDLAFPDGEAGDAARSVVARAVQVSHDRTCTVSRTVEAGTPVEVRVR